MDRVISAYFILMRSVFVLTMCLAIELTCVFNQSIINFKTCTIFRTALKAFYTQSEKGVWSNAFMEICAFFFLSFTWQTVWLPFQFETREETQFLKIAHKHNLQINSKSKSIYGARFFFFLHLSFLLNRFRIVKHLTE